MSDPLWIIRWSSDTRGMLLWANYGDGSHRWAGYNFLFPTNEQYPDAAKLCHFATQDEAVAFALQKTAENPHLIGKIEAELCWIKRCKKCHACLCGEGNRKRE